MVITASFSDYLIVLESQSTVIHLILRRHCCLCSSHI